MKVELRDEQTIIITPESTAELVVLQRFGGSTVEIEKPKPFNMNVEILKIEKVTK